MPKKKKHPTPAAQLRLFQQGSGEPRAAPLPAARATVPHNQPAPPDPTRTTAAVETLAALARRQAVEHGLPPAEIFARWSRDYRTALAGDWRLRHAPAIGLALLVEAAAPGLAAYAGQQRLSPDLIGQAFLACLSDTAAWQPYFPAWPEALAQARQFVPDGHEAAAGRLLEAARLARQDGQAVKFKPGRSQAAGYALIEPYLKPLIIGPPLTATPPLTLAVAAQFPAWLVAQGKIRFAWPPDLPPLLRQMQQLNALLYHLTPHLPQEWSDAD